MDDPVDNVAPASRDPTDLELLRRVQAGDRLAFRQLFFGYYRRLSRFLARLTNDQQLAEEIINDTLMVVWRGAERFDARSRVSTWIFGIAYRLAIKAFGKRKARTDAGESARILFAQDSQNGDGDLNGIELGELLERALRCLTAEQRAVLELAYVMGYSCAEIAAIVDCPVNTVKTRLFYARERVRSIWPVLDLPQNAGGRNE